MLPPPPRSTLFPYNDALPILRALTTTFTAALAAALLTIAAPAPAATTSRAQAEATARAIVARESTGVRSEEHTSELQSRGHLVCRLLLEKKKKRKKTPTQ